MVEKQHITTRCAKCGTTYPPDTLVCPKCRVILAKPHERPRTPGWFVVLLIVVILALLGYAAYLAWDQLVQHNYPPLSLPLIPGILTQALL